MDISLDRFYRLNRRAIIWIVLFALIYLLRQFFLLIFLTFIIGFFALPSSRYLMDRFGLPRRMAISIVYSMILITYVAAVRWITPTFMEEIGKVQIRFPALEAKLKDMQDKWAEKYPEIANILQSYVPEEEPASEAKGSEVQDEDAIRIYEKTLLENARQDVRQKIDHPEARLDPDLRGALEQAMNSEASLDDALFGEDRHLESLNEQELIDEVTGLREDWRGLKQEIASLEARMPESKTSGEDQPTAEALNYLYYKADVFDRAISSLRHEETRSGSFIDRTIAQWKSQILGLLGKVASMMLRFGMTSLLAILFSYLIVLDYVRLAREVKSLKSSKLRDFYEEAGQPVVRFVLAVGSGFQTIAVIAFLTALMLVVPLIVFKIPQVFLLTVIVFLTSLIPVIGVFFEMVAILLVTLNEYGQMDWHFYGIVISIIAVHGIAAYLIAPVIFGKKFRLNTVLVLLILYIGERAFGMWGLILGVPVANYVIRDVFAVPIVGELAIEAKRQRRKIAIKEDSASKPAS